MVGKSISGGPSLYLSGLIVFVFLYCMYLKKRNMSMYRKLIFTTLYIYIILVIEKTLMPIPVNHTQIEMWKEAFSHVKVDEYFNITPILDLNDNLWRNNMILNMIMFMPFGFLWPLYKGKFRLKYIFLSSLIFSLMIELYQISMAFTMSAPLWYADINDIIANVIGGLIGYSIFTLMSNYIFNNISRKEIYGGNYEKNN